MTAPDTAEGAAWRDLARDWVTIWQSELAALAEDREARELWQAGLDGWARIAEVLIAALPDAGLDPPRPDAPAGPASAAAAPDPRDAELAKLAARVAELERRLAAGE